MKADTIFGLMIFFALVDAVGIALECSTLFILILSGMTIVLGICWAILEWRQDAVRYKNRGG